MAVGKGLPERHGYGGMRILIVEDNPTNGLVLSSLVRRTLSATIDLVETAEEALSRCRQDRFDLVLIDQILPGMSGIDLLRLMRSEKNLKQTPVLLVTGSESTALAREAFEAGADAFVTKPVDAFAFMQLVSETLAGVAPAAPEPKS